MKAEDLRLNNWVEIKDQEVKTYAQVEGTGNLQHVAGQLWSIEEIEPIPLTEEWLERFGFEKILFSIPTAYKTEDGFRVKEDERGYWMQYKYGLVVIKHVHQLQNIYHALTGKELTIKEPKKCKYVKREGESCTLNNNCTYPNCKGTKYLCRCKT